MHPRTDEPVAHHPQIEHAGSERETAPREVALEGRPIAARGVQRESRPPVGREIAPHRARKVSGTAAHQEDDGGGCGQDTGGPGFGGSPGGPRRRAPARPEPGGPVEAHASGGVPSPPLPTATSRAPDRTADTSRGGPPV